jgi:putative MATE family efflux protein
VTPGSEEARLRGLTAPIPSVLLRLALPVFASQLLRIAYQWVDAIWVRGLGVNATAAVTTSVFVMWSVYALNDVVAIGVVAYISQLLGAGDRRRAGVAAYKALRASAWLGLLGTAAALLASRRIYGMMGAGPEVAAEGTRYLTIVLGAAPLPMMALTCESIMRASGDTRTPLMIDLCAVGLNAALDPLFIYGWGPLHGMGVAGAAWATVIAQATMVAGYLLMAARRHRAFPLARHTEGPPVRIAGLAKVGVPAALIGMLFSVVYIVFARSAARYGVASLAIVGIANRIEAIQFIVDVSIGTAGASLVGQYLGAGRPERAVEVIRTGVRWSVWIALFLTALMLLFPHAFIGLFTRDAEVHRIGVPYLRVLSLCLAFTGAEIVTAECVLGSGHTQVLSWIFTIVSLVRLPLAFLVPQWTGLGALGIAWVITITCAVRGILIVAWAARGTWRLGLGNELHGAAGVEPPPIQPPDAA